VSDAEAAGPSADDEARLRAYARDLADALDATLEGWVVRCIEDRCRSAGVVVDAAVHERAVAAGAAVRARLAPEVRALLEADIDDQATNPLALLRRAVDGPTRVLDDLGVPPVVRDDFDTSSFPDDIYSLSPHNFDDIDPSLHEPGLLWGAAKAYVFLARRRAEGRR
jgi:hypothetical protein